ncbi:effector-associated constant component EACC1 [Streptomyces smyrnaeus]|uniref:effector-associated constant component EACC1 n=1 Tax=Streptomyces smyrnaeus TaxID=1387713 RepID=UPI00367B7971
MIDEVLIAVSAAGIVPSLVRMLSLWKRSRRSSEVIIEREGVKLRLNLSDPKDAEAYLEVLQKHLNPSREG